MVYFHFPFSTHAPVPIPKLTCFSELNLQDWPEGFAAGSRGPTLVNSCAKNNLEKVLDNYPIISYLYRVGSQEKRKRIRFKVY
jgi:hypothetical protein